MKIVFGALALGGLAGVASAQLGQTRLEWLVSSDGGQSFADHADALPGSQVVVKARVSLIGATALGFSGINFQPVFTGFDSSGPGVDDFVAFRERDGSPDGGPNWARIPPFNAPNLTDLITHHVDAPGVMRLAQASITNPIGFGSGRNNVSGGGGFPVSQSTGLFAPPQSFVYGTDGVDILQLTLILSLDADPRVLSIDAPIGGISLYGPNNDVRAGNWLLGHDPETGFPITNYAAYGSLGAAIHVVPAAGSGLVFTALILSASRRRRA